MVDSNEIKKETISRVKSLRIRTIILTLALVGCIAFYCLMQWIITGEINVVGLVISAIIQISTHFAYFDDGLIYGEKDDVYKANRTAYNNKADKINENKQFNQLREYCKVEFEQRKKRYVDAKLSYIGITHEEFEELKHKSIEEIKNIEKFEFDGRIMFFTKKRRKALYNLIFNEIPIEENEPEFIMSAVSFNKSKAISDGSTGYETRAHIIKILWATVVACFLAYISFTFKTFGWENLVEMGVYLITMIITAVFSYTAGEKGTKVYKSKFYNELSMFLDGFNTWYETLPKNDENLFDKQEVKE